MIKYFIWHLDVQSQQKKPTKQNKKKTKKQWNKSNKLKVNNKDTRTKSNVSIVHFEHSLQFNPLLLLLN